MLADLKSNGLQTYLTQSSSIARLFEEGSHVG
jgi:hypothetical protein